MELIKPQKGTNYNIEHDIQNLTTIEQEFEQIDNKITNDITSSIDELKDKVDNDITTAITELDNKVDTEIVTAIDNLETKVNTEISESITTLDNKVTTSLQEQAESLKKEISDQIAKVVANSPEDFDTLKEISDWISSHSSDATAMNSAISGNTSAINQEILDRQAADTALQNALNNKVDKVSGKGLSTNDFTNADKTKLDGIEAGANKTVIDSALSSTSTNPVQNKIVNAALNNKVDKVSGKGLSTNDFTTAEKNKLAEIATGANKTTVDSSLSTSSTNPVQNKVVYTALGNKVDKNLSNVTGVLPIANGGTGKTTAKGAQNALLSDMQTETSAIGDTTEFVMKYVSPTDTKGAVFKRSATLVWDYIKSKISSVLGLTATQYDGNAKTSTQATGATPFNAAQQTVIAGTVTRAVAQNVVKSGNGYISRIALGLTNKISQFSDGIISLGSNDAGTSWEDFTLKKGTGGQILTSATVDTELNSTSTNPVQNKVVNSALSGKANISDLDNKVDKVSGKGLSTNDYTTTEKNKLAGIAEGANKTVVDTALSSTSTNPVQNKVVNTALGNKVDKNSRITIPNNSVSLTSYGQESLSIGDATGKNIGIDGDDIQARNGATAAILDLNFYGGMVRINANNRFDGGLQVGGRLSIPTSAPKEPKAGDIWIG